MKQLLNEIDFREISRQFAEGKPFNHVVIDNFLLPEVADQLSEEFPDYNDPILGSYDNVLENKKVCNRWDKFPRLTYQFFTMLGREQFQGLMRFLVNDRDLYLDTGLNGGGWHMHGRGGNNNVHLDYNIHPKLGEQRKLNIIVYLTKDWQPEWNGGLEVWSADENGRPKALDKVIENVYNRAVIFDTTQNSWHGLPNKLTCPEGVVRKSLAAYYVRPAPIGTDPRGKALFAPREDQKNDPVVLETIHKRSNVFDAESFHQNKK